MDYETAGSRNESVEVNSASVLVKVCFMPTERYIASNEEEATKKLKMVIGTCTKRQPFQMAAKKQDPFPYLQELVWGDTR